MRANSAAIVFLTAYATTICNGAAQQTGIETGTPPAQINSVAFAQRAPLQQFTYFQAIKYIDDDMKYIDGASAFFVSPSGEMCFRTRASAPLTIYDDYYSDWCIYPNSVSRVEANTNQITHISEIRLWCSRAYPQCAQGINYPWAPWKYRSWNANSITIQTLAPQQEQAALQRLIFVMGGTTGLPAIDDLRAGRPD
jgi:hypothetical protein